MLLSAEASLRWWAAGAGLCYFAACMIFGERYPFSIYGMYAGTAGRGEGAVPVFLADGTAAAIENYHSFSGMNLSRIHPPGLSCSLEWQVHEMRRWIERHWSEPGRVAGPIKVQVGYRVVSVDGGGRQSEALQIAVEGRAWPR